MRFKFAADIPNADTGHVYMTDGIRYRVLPASYQIDGAHTKAGAGPITTLTKTDLPSGWTFARLVTSLCGTPDPGELGDVEPGTPPTGGGLTEDQVRAVVRAELDRTKLAS